MQQSGGSHNQQQSGEPAQRCCKFVCAASLQLLCADLCHCIMLQVCICTVLICVIVYAASLQLHCAIRVVVLCRKVAVTLLHCADRVYSITDSLKLQVCSCIVLIRAALLYRNFAVALC